MTSRFNQYASGAARAFTGVMGETATITPRAKASKNYASPVADPDRALFVIEGIFSLAPKNSNIQGQKRGGDFTGATRISVSEAEFWISSENYATAATEIRGGDLLSLNDGADNYTVSDPRKNDTGDYELILTREKI